MTRAASIVQTTIMIAAFVGCVGEVDRSERNTPMPPSSPAQEFAMLDAYGSWQTVPGSGEVWRPNVAYDWAPYRIGEWEWTDRGWMWMSDERFGWVVYHYGFWEYDENLGWLWVPGYDWYPARVTWYVTDDVIGWAPLPPRGVPTPRPDQDVPGRWWSFVDTRDFVSADVNAHRYHEYPRLTGAPGTNPPDARRIGRTRGEDVPRFRTESQPYSQHGRELQQIVVRPDEPYGVSQPPPPSIPPTRTPMDLPVGQKRGEAVTPPPPPPNQPERGQSKRPVDVPPPAQPLPPPPSAPAAGNEAVKHTTVKTPNEAKTDTVKTKSRVDHKR